MRKCIYSINHLMPKWKGVKMTSHYSYVDVNEEILEIGVGLGCIKEYLEFESFAWQDSEANTIYVLDRCLELWIKYNEISRPLQWVTVTWEVET
jgi:hypothetical protein